MTVQTSTTVATGIGNGVTTIFPVGYKFNRDTDLFVVLIDDETGQVDQLTLNSDYTVQGEGREDGGSVTTIAPVPDGKTITIMRIVSLLQLTDLRNQGKFFAEIHEDTFDLIVMMAQQQQEQLDRAVKVPIGGDTPPEKLFEEFKQDIADADAAARASEEARDESQAIAEKFGDVDGAVTAAEQARDEAINEGSVPAVQAADRAEGAAARAESASSAAYDAVQYDYLTDTFDELDAITGVTEGQRGFVRASERIYRYNGFNWINMGLSPTATKANTYDPKNAVLYSLPSEVVVDTAAKTVTFSGGRIVAGTSTAPISSGQVSYDASAISSYFAYNLGTSTFSSIGAGDIQSLGAESLVFARIEVATGELSGLPGGYMRNGVLAGGKLSAGVSLNLPEYINFNFLEDRIEVSSNITLVKGIQRVLVGPQSVSLSEVTNTGWSVIAVDEASGQMFVFNASAVIPDNLVVVGGFRKSSKTVIGFDRYYIDGSPSGTDSSLKYGLALTFPDRINFDFIARNLEITGNLQILDGSTRILVPPQTVDLSSISRTAWGMLMVDPATGIVSTALAVVARTPNLVVFGGFLASENRVAGIDNYSVNGVPNGTSSEPVASAESPILLGWDLPGVFSAPEMPGYRPSDPMPFTSITTSDIQGWFDGLVTAHPEYITRTLLGNEPGAGKPIYAYKFTPDRLRMIHNPETFPDYPMLRVMIQGAIHNEPMSFVYPFHLMDLIANHWEGDEILTALRWGVEFNVIPVLNPWGVDNNSQLNFNSVNLNRNYPVNWIFSEASGQQSGPAPLSEVENQLSYQMMTEYKPHILFDCHDFGLSEDNRNMWSGSTNRVFQGASVAAMNTLARKWATENPWMPPASMLGHAQSGQAVGTTARTAAGLGIIGGTFEFARDLYYEPGRIAGSPLAIRYAVEALGNSLVMTIKKFT